MTARKKKQPWPPERVFVVQAKFDDGTTMLFADTTGRKAMSQLADHGDGTGANGDKYVAHGEWCRPVRPTDETDFYALAEAIDQHLGWRNDREREAGDYVGRIKQVGKLLSELAKSPRIVLAGQSEAWENGVYVRVPRGAPKHQASTPFKPSVAIRDGQKVAVKGHPYLPDGVYAAKASKTGKKARNRKAVR